MKYMGSKRRIAKHILPIILKDRKPYQWYIEPFVGGANMIEHVDGKRAGFDINPYLISTLCKIRDGWLPPTKMTEYGYKSIKEFKERYKPWLVGYTGVACSFGAKWFSGYCRSHKEKRDYILEAKNNSLKQAPKLKGCLFACRSYDKLNFKEPCVIYCDPPYKDTTGYKIGEFNHDDFWEWCRNLSKKGHKIFISEYQAPNDFECVWEKEQLTTMAANLDYKKTVERLFIKKLT